MPELGNYVDPYRAYNFRLEIQGEVEGYFTYCDSLRAEVTPIEWREGGSGRVVHALPGRLRLGSVTMRFGVTASTRLWNWFQEIMAGRTVRMNVSIIMLDNEGQQETVRYNLFEAWPSKWEGPELAADGNEVAIESLTLSYSALERA